MEEQKLLKKKKQLKSKDNKTVLAVVCNNLADIYFREGKYEQAIHEYKTEATLYKEVGKRILYAKASRMIGEVYATMAEFEQAIKYQTIHLGTIFHSRVGKLVIRAYGTPEVVAREERCTLEEQRALASIGRLHLISALSNPDKTDQESLHLAYGAFMQSLLLCESLKEISKQEQMDMRVRLLLNMGVVKENIGNFEEGIEYMLKSIKICKKYDIYEQLNQGYITLGMLYARKNDDSTAITYLNLAIETADRLSDKIPPMCATLLNKSEILIKLGEFQSARQCLLKAYKLKSPNQEERQTIEHNLKVLAAMCKAEDSLLTADDSNYNYKKKLYEKMGDGACDLKNYDKAIDYYKKMLECSEKAGDKDKELVSAYVSLAQTYKDKKQYDLSLTYFRKEYDINCDNPEESYYTLLNIADILILLKSDFNKIAETFEQAKKDAKATGNKRTEGKVMLAYIDALKKYNKFSEASALEKELVLMDYVASENEDEEVEGGTPNIGNDISISDISDLSDNNEVEDASKPRNLRKRNKGILVKKNNKGETQLHTACIANNFILVRQLLEQGHPPNIRDNCGWLPLHEACNYGYTEIVRLLLDKGASVNDRGGTLCNGITPLHDAASNGHLEIIELLLERGASPIMQTDDGQTPLDLLQLWYNSKNLNVIEETYCETLVARLTSILEKAGRTVPNKTNGNTSPTNNRLESSVQDGRRKSPRQLTPLKKSHRSFGSSGDDDAVPSCSGYSRKRSLSSEKKNKRSLSPTYDESSNSDVETTVQKEYKQVMDNLRKRAPKNQNKKSPSAKVANKSAFLNSQEVGDDWLDDDLGVNQPVKKRKTDATIKQNLLESSGMRRSNSFNSRRSVNSNPTTPVKNGTDVAHIEPLEIFNLNENSNDSCASSSTSSASRRRRTSQSSLLESGFTRQRNDVISNLFSVPFVNQINNKSYKRQQKIASFVTNQDVCDLENYNSIDNQQILNNSAMNTAYGSIIGINVQIEDKTWRIPVPADDVVNLTIGWLAMEAAKRYNKREGISPTLQLEIKGAILENDDPLSMVFISPTQSDEVQSSIISWDLPPLPERYVEICKNCNKEVNQELRERLEECQGTLSLKLADISIENQEFVPLLRALKRQNNLQHIDLSGTGLQDEHLQELSKILPTIVQLRSLNLSFNCITGEGLRCLSEILTTTNSKPILENLVDLNLSYNTLGDACLQYLAVIVNRANLRILNMSACSLTNHIFEHVCNRGVNLNFDNLEYLNLSYNELNNDSIIMFIAFLNFTVVNKLDFSHNRHVTESGIAKEIAAGLQNCDLTNLKSLNLARCKISDPEVYDLLHVLFKAVDLEYLNLSYNPDLTSVTLRRILQNKPTFANVCLEGCCNITQYLDIPFSISSIEEPYGTNSIKDLKISIDYKTNINQSNILTTMWEKEWGAKAKIEKMFDNFLHLSVTD